MNKATFDAMLAQYAVQEASGEGAASWDGGVRCVLPEVLVYGKAVQDGTPTPDAPVMPEFSAGTEVVSRGKNLFDADAFFEFYSNCKIPSEDNRIQKVIEDGRRCFSFTGASGYHPDTGYYIFPFPGKENTQYTISFAAKQVEPTPGITTGISFLYRNNATFHIYADTAVEWVGKMRTSPPDTTIVGLRLSYYYGGRILMDIDSIQIEEGTTATPYVPYFDGGSATAPELLAIPGTKYRDEWNPQTGKGVRRVFQFEPNGTESWNKNASHGEYESFYIVKVTTTPIANGTASKGLCNVMLSMYWDNVVSVDGNYFWNARSSCGFRIHKSYLGDDYDTLATDADKVNRFKDFLAAKVAAGTPVIAWLPAQDEPFETAPQPLIAPKGTGHIMQVGGTLDAVPISAKYVTHS